LGVRGFASRQTIASVAALVGIAGLEEVSQVIDDAAEVGRAIATITAATSNARARRRSHTEAVATGAFAAASIAAGTVGAYAAGSDAAALLVNALSVSPRPSAHGASR
jgi:hypothetical protein